jgi:hypothetical protein
MLFCFIASGEAKQTSGLLASSLAQQGEGLLLLRSNSFAYLGYA